MDWTELTAALSYYMEQEQPDASFTAATPTMVSNAEQKCYRDLNLAASSGENTSLATSIGGRVLDLSGMSGQDVAGGTPVAYPWPVVVEAVYAQVGTRWVPYQVVSKDFLDFSWPDPGMQAPPSAGFAFYCMLDNLTALLAPTPDAVYPLRITGQWRPMGISQANPVTWLATYLPDVFFAAVMVEAFIYQRDWGTGSADPQALPLWQSRYHELLGSAKVEENLKQALGPGYLPFAPAPLAQPAPQQPSA
jgi:hypothetical protein